MRDLIKPTKHKQSKYFTIMLIPSSSNHTWSLKIPFWVIHFTFVTLILMIVTMLSFSLAANHFKVVAETINMDLEESLNVNNELKEESDKLQSQLVKEKENTAALITKESRSYEEKIKYFEDKSEELKSKIDELQDMKQQIFDKISSTSYLPEDDVAHVLNEDHEYREIGLGGPEYAINSTNDDKLKDLMSTYSALESEIAYQLDSYQNLLVQIDRFKPYFENYPTTWPVYGKITSEFGGRSNPFSGAGTEFHSGLDIGVPIGTEVKSTGGGTVTFSGYRNGYGNIVIISHGFGIETYFAHNSKLLVKVNEQVERGQVIALSGNTGRSTGPHVHYEVRVNGTMTNPRKFLTEN